MMSLLNSDLLGCFNASSFMQNAPCPWSAISGVLTDDAFQKLNDEFPGLEVFEKHAGLQREHAQRPHDRYYLALERSLYGKKKQGTPGCVAFEQLGSSWQQLIKELQTSSLYMQFIQESLGVERPTIRFAWHVAGAGKDVAPHCDSPNKAGTHIFYFNTSADWQDSWGGSTVFLSGKKTDAQNPEIDDFEHKSGFSVIGNRSMLFENTPNAWHAVERLGCPEGSYRRIFNVIVHHHQTEKLRRRVTRTLFTALGVRAA